MAHRTEVRANRALFLYLTLAVALTGACAASAQVLWTGPVIAYNQPAPDPTQPANPDRLTANVVLTRAKSKGLFNAAAETAAGQDSPLDTEWAFGTLDQYSTLQFQTWLTLLDGASPTTLVGQPL
ncbi:MAG TPA: hypothetical protein VG897_15300, partial [Terriglobales bacterium]|nr:hypothetical protein [Terriglobales bacterium]